MFANHQQNVHGFFIRSMNTSYLFMIFSPNNVRVQQNSSMAMFYHKWNKNYGAVSGGFFTLLHPLSEEHRRADANSVITLIDSGLKGIHPTPHTSYPILRLLRNYCYHERHLCHGYRGDRFNIKEFDSHLYRLFLTEKNLAKSKNYDIWYHKTLLFWKKLNTRCTFPCHFSYYWKICRWLCVYFLNSFLGQIVSTPLISVYAMERDTRVNVK